MAWWKMKWLKFKNRPASRNGAHKSKTALEIPKPAVQQIAESIDPRRLITWILGIAAATAYFIYRWKKRYPEGAPAPSNEAAAEDAIDAEAEPTKVLGGRAAFLRALSDLAGRAKAALSRQSR